VAALLAARCRHPSWGAQTRVSLLSTHHPRWPWPARATVWDLRSRHHVRPRRRKRRAIGHPGQPTSHNAAPHEVWSADVTGHFQTGDGRYGSPLTSTARYRRVRLGCEALSATRVQEATPVFTRVVKACGWPPRLRPDSGVPCATNPLARLSPVSAWWVRLGLLPECIDPGNPPQHGRHARRQRTLHADTTRPPGANLRAPPRPFHPCRAAGTHARPHEALDLPTPAACDAPSPRKMPHKRPPRAYPDRVEVRDIRAHGGIRGHHPWGNVSPTCVGEDIGLEASDEGVWQVDVGPLTRGRLLERPRRMENVYGRLTRHRGL
jgi:putative transposase